MLNIRDRVKIIKEGMYYGRTGVIVSIDFGMYFVEYDPPTGNTKGMFTEAELELIS